MLKSYPKAALYARKMQKNRLILEIVAMSNKFALSDIKEYALRYVGKQREIALIRAKRVFDQRG